MNDIAVFSAGQTEPLTPLRTVALFSGKVASAFQLLGLDVTAKQEEVRRAYRRLAPWWKHQR